MRYDPTYASTVATAIPVIFVAIVVDLGLGRGSSTPRSAAAVMTAVIVLLISELLCLNALSVHRELRTGESDLVAGAMIFSGVLIFFRVAGPIVSVLRSHRTGKWMVRISMAGFFVLWFLHSLRVVTGGTALVIFGLCVLCAGMVFAAFVRERPPYVVDQKTAPDSAP